MAPLTAAQPKLMEDVVDTPQFIVALNMGLIEMVNVVVIAHCPTAGVKVYVVVAVLFKAGDHVPLILLSEVVGKAVSGSPEQIAATGLKVGGTLELTVIVNVVVVAH